MFTCQCCGELKPNTKHHVYPVRHYGKFQNTSFFMCCRECHSELETYIPMAKMPRKFYPAICLLFKTFLCPLARKNSTYKLFE